MANWVTQIVYSFVEREAEKGGGRKKVVKGKEVRARIGISGGLPR